MLTLSVGSVIACHDRQQTNRYDIFSEIVQHGRHLFEHAYENVEEITIQGTMICIYSRSSRCCAVSLFASIAKSLYSRPDVSS